MRSALFFAVVLLAAQPLAAQQCNRICLRDMLDQYFAALVKHDPGKLPLSSTVRFTEDTIEIAPGEGLWKTATGMGAFRQDVLDVRQSTAGSHVVVMEDDKPVLFTVRLKIFGLRIHEIETMVVRNQREGQLFQVNNIKSASEAFTKAPPKDRLNSREDAVRIAALYPAGLKVGSFVKADVPFAPEAYRFENGGLMAGPKCTLRAGCEDIKGQSFPTLSETKHRLLGVDEEQGIVWLRIDFGRSPVRQTEEGLVVWEMFKVYGGQIHAVEAFMELMPLGTPSGWD